MNHRFVLKTFKPICTVIENQFHIFSNDNFFSDNVLFYDDKKIKPRSVPMTTKLPQHT